MFKLMLFSLILIFLFVFVATYLGVKVEGPYTTKSRFVQVKSDIWTRPCHVSSMSIHKLILTRSLHTVERPLVDP